MATPAASAWHRRRILSQPRPSSGISNFQTPAFGGSAFHSRPRPPIPQEPTPRTYTSGRPLSAPVPSSAISAQPSLFRGASVLSSARSQPTQSSLSVNTLLNPVLAPFLSFAPTAVVDVFVATVITLCLFHLFRFFAMATFGNVLLSCSTELPRLSFSVTVFSFLLFFPLLVILLATHFILSTSLNATPPRKAIYFSVALFTTPLHALGFAYLLYGPSLSPYQFFCSAPSSLLPTRNSLHTPVLSAFTFIPFLYIFIFHLRLHTALPYPFPRSRVSLSLAAVPQALILAAIPGLLVLPVSLITAFVSRPPRSTYASILLTLSRAIAAVHASTAAILPHLLLHFSTLNRTAAATFGEHNSDEAHVVMSSADTPERARIALIVASSGKIDDLKQFAPFADPSGRMWRATLEATLSPFLALLTALRSQHSYTGAPFQSTLFMSVKTQEPSSKAAILNVPEVSLRESIPVLRALAVVLEASVKHDSFGVVLPTVPTTLSLLLAIHEGLCDFLSISNGAGVAQKPYTHSILRPLERWVAGRSQERLLWALKDSVVVCIYRVTYTFREQIASLVDGREVGWEPEATEALRPFIEFCA